jgi:dihydropteroate synthase
MLVGLSRKSMLGKITGSDINNRIHASIAAALIAAMKGAAILRVHDVRATRDALAVYNTVYDRGSARENASSAYFTVETLS